MLRRILLGAIMVVSMLIIVMALQRLYEKQASRKPRKEPTALAARPAGGVEFRKFDKQNNLVAIIRGQQIGEIPEKGPVDILKPVVTIFRDKSTFVVITADTGRVEGREQDRMQEGWLKDNVVMTMMDRAREDNTVITCDEVKFNGEKQEVFVPGMVRVRNRSLDLTGVSLTADWGLGKGRIDRDVQLTLAGVSGGVFEPVAVGKTPQTPAGAEVATDKPAEPPTPIVITCEGALVFESGARRATFQREVRAVQGDNRVRADLMTVDIEPVAEAQGETPAAETPPAEPLAGPKPSRYAIRRVVMTADRKEGVVVEGPNRQGWGDRFEYDAKEGLLVYSGSPCRASQKSQSQTFRLEGLEIRFGRKRFLSQAEVLPAGMTETSQKVLLTGKPATVVSIPADAGEPMALAGDRILFDQDARVAWLEGAPDRRASASQGRNRIEGVEVLLAQKTESREEQASAKGPGRLETETRAREEGGSRVPASVDFGGDMTYKPAERQALFTGGVTLNDGATKCVCRALTVEFDEGAKAGSREVRRMIATGDVVVTGDRADAKSDMLVYGYAAPGGKLAEATLTAKPGESCDVRQGDLYCRAPRVEMAESPLPGGKKALRAKAVGKGFIQYRPAPRADAAAPSQPFDVQFATSGSFDDAKLLAVFEDDVHLSREGMNLTARHVELNFLRKEAAAPEPGKKASAQLEVASIFATTDVVVTKGKDADSLRASGAALTWDRVKQKALLVGDERVPARVLRDKNELTAPRMDVTLKNDSFDRLITTGSGHMTGYTQTSLGTAAKGAPAAGATPAPAKLQKLDVTWDGEGFYQALETKDPANEPTAFVRVKENAKAVGEDSDCTADALMIYLGPTAAAPAAAEGEPAPSAPEGGSLKLEVRTAVASGNARAKAFNVDTNAWRFARGDTLEWDRLTGRMVISSEKGDAVVWDNSNEWVGKQLVVNRNPEGKYEASSTSGRRITFYEEGTPKIPSDDGKKWKPIY